MINEQGRERPQDQFHPLDDAYSPRKREQVRRLVESDESLFLDNPVGNRDNIAVLKYLNQKKVPLCSSPGARSQMIPSTIRGP